MTTPVGASASIVTEQPQRSENEFFRQARARNCSERLQSCDCQSPLGLVCGALGVTATAATYGLAIAPCITSSGTGSCLAPFVASVTTLGVGATSGYYAGHRVGRAIENHCRSQEQTNTNSSMDVELNRFEQELNALLPQATSSAPSASPPLLEAINPTRRPSYEFYAPPPSYNEIAHSYEPPPSYEEVVCEATDSSSRTGHTIYMSTV